MNLTVKEHTGAAIQQSIDAAGAAGGGTVSLEPGIYPSGTLHLRSNIELHLPAGAVILGHAESGRYEDFRHPGFDAVAPEDSRKCLIACADCENVSITGPGEINGQGPEFFDRNVPSGQTFAKPPWPRPRMIQFFNCRNVVIRDVSLLDSPGWTCWLIQCENVHVSRIRIEGCQQMINQDGIDIDSCRKVTVSDSFFKTGDDCLILRAIRHHPDRPSVCEKVTVSNCILDSRCQGIRIGCPSDDTIRHCSFSHITFHGSGSGIHSEHPYRYLRKNCSGYVHIHDLSFDHFDIESGAYPIRLGCEGAIALRGLERISFSNFRIRSKLPVYLSGNPKTVFSDLVFRDISGTVEGDTAIFARFVRNLQLDRFTLTAEQGEEVPFERVESASWETRF